MDFIIEVLFDTEWGAIIVGALLLIGLLLYGYEKK